MSDIRPQEHGDAAYKIGGEIVRLVKSLEGGKEALDRVHDLVRMHYECSKRAGMAEIAAMGMHRYHFETTHDVTPRNEANKEALR